jgi:NAD(P)-dependent dehydrogenase (short-subunit alcohol dehydrogenase family)
MVISADIFRKFWNSWLHFPSWNGDNLVRNKSLNVFVFFFIKFRVKIGLFNLWLCRLQLVLITGAGHGIGRALALQFAKLGCTVIILDINAQWLDETREMLANGGSKVHAYICDVSKRDEVYACAKLIHNQVGNVTILVNNAGIVFAEFLLDLADEDVLRVFRTNCFAHFWVGNAMQRSIDRLIDWLNASSVDRMDGRLIDWLISLDRVRWFPQTLKAFLPYMMDQNHGHIVTIASIVGKGAGGKASEYISSKFAAVGLHEAMEMELRALRRTGINMTLVCPALVDTGLFEGAEYRSEIFLPRKGTECLLYIQFV